MKLFFLALISLIFTSTQSESTLPIEGNKKISSCGIQSRSLDYKGSFLPTHNTLTTKIEGTETQTSYGALEITYSLQEENKRFLISVMDAHDNKNKEIVNMTQSSSEHLLETRFEFMRRLYIINCQ